MGGAEGGTSLATPPQDVVDLVLDSDGSPSGRPRLGSPVVCRRRGRGTRHELPSKKSAEALTAASRSRSHRPFFAHSRGEPSAGSEASRVQSTLARDPAKV